MAAQASRKLFVNLAVADLARSVEFFNELGFSFDPRFTDETATCMVVSDDAYVMLLLEDRFAGFTEKHLADSKVQAEAIIALSAASRKEVDEVVDKALAAGGGQASEPQDMGFMYARSFLDPDGHQWELVWMDPSTVESGPHSEARVTS